MNDSCAWGLLCLLLRLRLHLRLCDPPVDVRRRLLPHLIGDVGVGVQRRGRRHMADDRRERLHIHPVFQGHGCKSMAQIMKSDSLAPRSVQDYLKPLADITRIDGLFRLGAGGKHQVSEDAPLILRQHLHHGGRQDDGAVGRLGLGFTEDQLAAHRIDLLVDAEFPGGKVQIAPPKGQQFSPAHPGGQLQEKQFVHPLRLGLDEEPLDLLLVSTFISLPFRGGNLHPMAGYAALDSAAPPTALSSAIWHTA